MSARLQCVLMLFALPACLASHGEPTAPELRDLPIEGQGGAPIGDDTAASASSDSGPLTSSSTDAEPSGAVDGGISAQDAGEVTGDASAPREGGLQVWVGEAHGADLLCREMYPSGLTTERVLLLFELGPSGDIDSASVTLGDGVPPPPARDPESFYPSGYEPAGCPMDQPVPGFEYPGHRPRLRGSRFEVTFYPRDFYASWCDLQESYPASEVARDLFGDDYLCRPSDHIQSVGPPYNGGSKSDTDPDLLCLNAIWRACGCDAERCGPLLVEPHVLDLLVEGDEMQGRLIGRMDGTAEVRLRRAQ